MWHIVCYDIHDDRRRTRVADLLTDFGDRIQYSVFELPVSEQQLLFVLDSLGRMIDPKTDSVYCFPVCRRCRKAIHTRGAAVAFEQDEVWIV